MLRFKINFLFAKIPTNSNNSISCLVGSGISSLQIKDKYLKILFMYIGGTVSGGLSATITGGDFAQGAAIWLVVTALNHALHEALDPDPTQQQKQKSKLVLQYEKENGVELFGSIYEAADDWGNKYNEISIKEGREYGSNLFEVKNEGDNWYGYTSPDKELPIRNEFGQLSINIITQPPKSSVIVAKIHAHSNGSLEFSTDDFNAVKNNGAPSYITNKAGELRFGALEKRNPFYIYSKRLNTWYVGEGYIFKISKYK